MIMMIKKSALLSLLHLSFLLHIIQISPTLCAHIQCKESERQALLEIKRELVDEYNHLSSWSPDDDRNRDCCGWRGVRCSNHSGHVVALDLRVTDKSDSIISGPHFIWSEYTYKPLKGNISLSIFKLRHLRYLDLSSNDFDGSPIPSFNISSLNLRYLNLSWAGLGGFLEYQLVNMSNLVSLDISYNNRIRYVGDSLAWLSNLSSLRILSLGYTDLGSAQDWFQVVNSLNSLTELSLGECNLSSIIPETVELETSSSLKIFKLWGNSFTNSLYRWLAKFQNSLVRLDLSDNLLDGFVPDFLGSMSSLVYLNLKYNKFRGGIPQSFGRLCNLQSLGLYSSGLDANLLDLVSNISGCLEKSLETLDLSENQLHGFLPDFERFSTLRTIDLSFNQLHGPIPDKFFQSSKLISIWLDENQLSGPLPDVTMLSSLKELYIRDNQLNGSFPACIGNLSNLELLDLSGNHLRGIISEAHFARLSKLRWLDLSGNSLSLRFSPNYKPPFRLDVIRLGSCNLGPKFPKWLQTQKSCFELNISNAQINDTIPSWFWDVSPRLVDVNLSSNGFHGQLPDLSSKFTRNFFGIDLSLNFFEGPLPFFPLNTTSLNLSKNKFSGNISVLCHIGNKEFKFLDLSDNFLSGKLSDCFHQWESLRVLSLAGNRFIGAIPMSIGSLSDLGTLDLHNNSFDGHLPSTLRNCKSLEFLDLSYNRFSGELPAWIGGLSSLIFLSLKSNLISGYIPEEFCQLENIGILDLSTNKISGTIPRCLHHLKAMMGADNSSTSMETSFAYPYLQGYIKYFYNNYVNRAIVIWKGRDYIYVYLHNINKAALRWKLKEYLSFYGNYVNKATVRWKGREYLFGANLGLLRIMDVSSNNLSGGIPEEITRLAALVALNLSRNRLDGHIPEYIGELKRIESLDLSRNLLSGDIPESMSDLSFLSNLDLSYNNLSGKIPLGPQLQGFNASSFEGNVRLCGLPILKKCHEEDGPARSQYVEEDDDDEFIKWLSTGIGLGFAFGFLGICATPMLRTSWRHFYLQFLDSLLWRLGITD